MNYIDFIKSLNKQDKENYESYSQIRGKQQYYIIFESLKKIDSDISYNDVNAFIKFDKAIKDVLYTFFGTLEEEIKNYIFTNFDATDEFIKKYPDAFKQIKEGQEPLIEKKEICDFEITVLYKKFALNFGGIVILLKALKNRYNIPYDMEKLQFLCDFRNDVMHHIPLLFDCDFNIKTNELRSKIVALIECLPERYRDALIEQINEKIEATKKNIKSQLYSVLISEL
ncbi:MAG: hypothetical protein J6Y28_08955 [Acholeplasmatales bacterium]|nr:hypothetical protein [Acholeplasmatales bacterium]